MNLRVVPVVLALSLAAAGCTSAPAPGSAAEAASRRDGATVAPDQGSGDDAADATPRSEDGPVELSSSGSLCIDTDINDERDYTYGEDTFRSEAPIELEAVELVRPRGIRIVEAWTFPSRGVPYEGSWSGWPLPKVATGHGRLEWAERRPAVGSRLDPGQPYNFLVRMRRDPGDEPQGFDAIRVEYRTSDQAYVLETETKVWFRERCR